MEVLNGKIGYTRTTVTWTVTSTCSSDYEVWTRQEETVDLVTIGDTIIYKYLRCYVWHNVRVSYIISNSPIQDLSEEELVMLDIQKQIGTIEA